MPLPQGFLWARGLRPGGALERVRFRCGHHGARAGAADSLSGDQAGPARRAAGGARRRRLGGRRGRAQF